LSLRTSYTFLAPFYDFVIERLLAEARKESLSALPRSGDLDVLISGIGTGLDLPHLPVAHRCVGIDLTRAMLDRAQKRRRSSQSWLVQGDSMRLPFKNESFDHVVLHLILAIVPDSVLCLRETARVLKRGGTILLLDKFLKRDERASLRRALNPFTSRTVTRLDVVFEDVLDKAPELRVVSDEPALFGGWLRQIQLVKKG
jgi:phosphatidylethanolamine/phosphatidyl-N-methylethanolamine N-methyltransferase